MDFSQFHRPEFQSFVQDHLQEDPALLLFKYQGKTAFDLKGAIQQISARQKARKKLPSWSRNPQLIFPASISLEQSSSEETAKFKSKGITGEKMLDLTGGFGVDCYYLGKGFREVVYCERQEELAQLASHNFEILKPDKFNVIHGDGIKFLSKTEEKFDLIYLDPARRGKGNQKLYRLADCEPDVISAWDLLTRKADQILIKASPMLDINQAIADLPELQKIQVIAVKNEVKELVLHWKKDISAQDLEIEAITTGDKISRYVFKPKEESEATSLLGEPENYLIEPYTSILKAGAFKSFGKRFGFKKLDANSHLYTSDTLPENLPARVFRIVEEVIPNKKEMKRRFPLGKVNVITRNYAIGAEPLKKKLGLKDGGEDFLIGTKTQLGFKIYWCRLA